MLELHRAERASTLATGLAMLLAEPLADTFTADVVAVPAKGVERWLQQRLSLSLGAAGASDGIAANIDFPSPGRLVDDVRRRHSASGIGYSPDVGRLGSPALRQLPLAHRNPLRGPRSRGVLVVHHLAGHR